MLSEGGPKNIKQRNKGEYNRTEGFTPQDEKKGFADLASEPLDTQESESNPGETTPQSTREPVSSAKEKELEKKLADAKNELAELKKNPKVVTKEVVKEVPKEWSGATLEEWQDGPKHLESIKASRVRAALKSRHDSHIPEAEKLGHAKALYKHEQIEKQKPFGWKMVTGALLGGVALSVLASPITGFLGISGLSTLAWRGMSSIATAFAVGGLTARRLEKRNFKNAGTWGLTAGILAGLGSFIGGEYIASLLGGTPVGTSGDLNVGGAEQLNGPESFQCHKQLQSHQIFKTLIYGLKK